MAWISGRVPAGGFTLTNTDISIWGQESNMNANAAGRYRVYRYQPGSPPTITELGGGPFNDNAEFGTTAAEMTWAGDVTDQAFNEDDRILIRLFITNAPALTMAGAFTCTLTFNAADAATGDSFFNIAETVTFKPELVSIDVSDTTASALSETAELLVSLALSEALAAILAETLTSLPVLLMSDALPVQLAETLTSLALTDLAETLAVSLIEQPDIFVPLAALSDSFGVSVSELSTAVVTVLALSETFPVGVSETSASRLLAMFDLADTTAVTASELAAILGTLLQSDTLAPQLADLVDLVVLVQIGDQTAVGLAEQASLLAVLATLADSLGVRLVEGPPDIVTGGIFPVSASDALAVALVESTPTIIIVLSAADTVRVALGEAPAILSLVATADVTPIMMQEAAAIASYLQTADAAAIALLEADPTILSTLGITDPVRVILDDAANVVTIVLSQDTISATLAELASVLGIDANLLGPAYLSTLRALVPARSLAVVGGVRTLTAVGAVRTLETVDVA